MGDTEKTQPDNLTEQERLELQNLLLKRDLYELQIKTLNEQHQRAVGLLLQTNEKFKTWSRVYEENTLQKHGLKMSDVDIDAESGKVILSNRGKMTIPPVVKTQE